MTHGIKRLLYKPKVRVHLGMDKWTSINSSTGDSQTQLATNKRDVLQAKTKLAV